MCQAISGVILLYHSSFGNVCFNSDGTQIKQLEGTWYKPVANDINLIKEDIKYYDETVIKRMKKK